MRCLHPNPGHLDEAYHWAPSLQSCVPQSTFHSVGRVVSRWSYSCTVANFQTCESASNSSNEPEPVPSAAGKSDTGLALHLLWLTILQLHHLPPPPFPPPISNSSCLFTPAPVCQLLYCTILLFKVLDCKIKHVLFIFCICLFLTF